MEKVKQSVQVRNEIYTKNANLQTCTNAQYVYVCIYVWYMEYMDNSIVLYICMFSEFNIEIQRPPNLNMLGEIGSSIK